MTQNHNLHLQQQKSFFIDFSSSTKGNPDVEDQINSQMLTEFSQLLENEKGVVDVTIITSPHVMEAAKQFQERLGLLVQNAQIQFNYETNHIQAAWKMLLQAQSGILVGLVIDKDSQHFLTIPHQNLKITNFQDVKSLSFWPIYNPCNDDMGNQQQYQSQKDAGEDKDEEYYEEGEEDQYNSAPIDIQQNNYNMNSNNNNNSLNNFQSPICKLNTYNNNNILSNAPTTATFEQPNHIHNQPISNFQQQDPPIINQQFQQLDQQQFDDTIQDHRKKSFYISYQYRNHLKKLFQMLAKALVQNVPSNVKGLINTCNTLCQGYVSKALKKNHDNINQEILAFEFIQRLFIDKIFLNKTVLEGIETGKFRKIKDLQEIDQVQCSEQTRDFITKKKQEMNKRISQTQEQFNNTATLAAESTSELQQQQQQQQQYVGGVKSRRDQSPDQRSKQQQQQQQQQGKSGGRSLADIEEEKFQNFVFSIGQKIVQLFKKMNLSAIKKQLKLRNSIQNLVKNEGVRLNNGEISSNIVPITSKIIDEFKKQEYIQVQNGIVTYNMKYFDSMRLFQKQKEVAVVVQEQKVNQMRGKNTKNKQQGDKVKGKNNFERSNNADGEKGKSFYPPPPPPAPPAMQSSLGGGGGGGFYKNNFMGQPPPSMISNSTTSSTLQQQSSQLGSSYGRHGGGSGYEADNKWKKQKKQNKFKGNDYQFLKTIRYKSNCSTLKDLYEKVEKFIWSREQQYYDGGGGEQSKQIKSDKAGKVHGKTTEILSSMQKNGVLKFDRSDKIRSQILPYQKIKSELMKEKIRVNHEIINAMLKNKDEHHHHHHHHHQQLNEQQL